MYLLQCVWRQWREMHSLTGSAPLATCLTCPPHQGGGDPATVIANLTCIFLLVWMTHWSKTNTLKRSYAQRSKGRQFVFFLNKHINILSIQTVEQLNSLLRKYSGREMMMSTTVGHRVFALRLHCCEMRGHLELVEESLLWKWLRLYQKRLYENKLLFYIISVSTASSKNLR